MNESVCDVCVSIKGAVAAPDKCMKVWSCVQGAKESERAHTTAPSLVHLTLGKTK